MRCGKYTLNKHAICSEYETILILRVCPNRHKLPMYHDCLAAAWPIVQSAHIYICIY